MSRKATDNIIIENARIIFRNFSGTGTQESNLGQAADECSGDDRFAGADARRFLCILFHQGDRCCVVYGVCRGGPRVHGGLCGNVRI